ncbi:protein preY, mitochondrial [Triplophysa rosa]|uniref:Protein preY, mitochondrial n=1 Tax=Triplophysa rosa TaxID=992332 RepID=A0A9W7X0U0_TRIRA|nr:protein preY, mitochondrial [Triplophysa rosa]KAI7812047.1 protein preY [Triplophysa rosa]
MSQHALRRLITGVFNVQRSETYRSALRVGSCVKINKRCRSDEVKGSEEFDVSILEFLVCPLSKKQLRYDEKSNELINEELGIAYPIIDGIPNMIPQDARMIQKMETSKNPSES